MKTLVISSMFMFLVVGVIGCGKSQEVTNPIFENQVSANSIPENQVSENKIQYHADAVLFAGDMIDYLSTENIKCFKIGLDQIKTPSIYVRSDHDVGIGYTPNISKSYANQLLQEVGKNESIYLMEYKQLLVLGINNSASQITKQQMEEITNIYNNATKPIVVVTHVPINSMIDNGLKKASLELRENRALVWGMGCYYKPWEDTQKFLDLVYEKDSKIVAVLGGHLHFEYDCQLTDSVREHVFDASYKGNIGVITISGTNSDSGK